MGVPRSFDEAVAELTEARTRTLELVSGLSDEALTRVYSPLLSPLAWDLGHIAAFEDLWLSHRLGGQRLLRGDLAAVYDAFETPRADRGGLPMLGPGDARAYLTAVRGRALATLRGRGVGDGRLAAMVIRHEHQHNETMLQTLQLAGLPGPSPAPAVASAARDPNGGGLELVEVRAGPCTLGANAEAFSYDNERPRHHVELPGFRIGRTPITNATWLSFAEGGGYVRREWWSDEGWAWKEEYDITRPGGWTFDLARERRFDRLEALDPHRPVVHVSWFEAEAFARAHGARLPSEAEWEKAATWDEATGATRRYPWGEAAPEPGVHANLDARAHGTLPVGAHPAGTSPSGCLAMIGDVWEWTASHFAGYPGFRADPYSEYSEVFFGCEYRALRGGSWATRPGIASPTFRNWDFPERRQIFSGLRIAQDL